MRSRHSREGRQADNSVRAALLRARFRWKGWYQARRDVRDEVGVDHEGQDGMVASTPFLRELRATAQRAADQSWAALEVEQARLLAELGMLAAAVVRYGYEETVHHRRFYRGLGSWDGAARRARTRLDATVTGLAQIQDAYWNGLVRGHRALGRDRRARPPQPKPAPITCVGLWPPTSTALLTGWDDADPEDRVPTVLDQAIEIVLKMASSTPPRQQRGDGCERG